MKVARSLLRISWIILSYPLADCFEFRAYMAGICLCHQNINKYLNMPAKRLRKNNFKFLRRSVYFRTVMLPPHYNKLLILFPISLCWLKMVVCCKSWTFFQRWSSWSWWWHPPPSSLGLHLKGRNSYNKDTTSYVMSMELLPTN